MSLLLGFLLNLLVSFIVMLIERWLNKNSEPPTEAYLISAKQEFLNKVKPRFWLGPKRLDRASKAYDLAVRNYANAPKLYFADGGRGYEKEIAQAMVGPITPGELE